MMKSEKAIPYVRIDGAWELVDDMEIIAGLGSHEPSLLYVYTSRKLPSFDGILLVWTNLQRVFSDLQVDPPMQVENVTGEMVNRYDVWFGKCADQPIDKITPPQGFMPGDTLILRYECGTVIHCNTSCDMAPFLRFTPIREPQSWTVVIPHSAPELVKLGGYEEKG
jgi:hypothetical protein